MVYWTIWQRCNKARANEPILPAEKTSTTARAHLQEFHKLRNRFTSIAWPQQAVWRPSDPSTWKTNYNGAMFVEQNVSGVGEVVRNSKGEVLAVLSEKIPQPPLVVLLETMAARKVVYFVHKIGTPSSILEGDSEISTNALRHENFSNSSFGHLIKDIMSSISFFQNYSLLHTLKQGNALAHAPVKKARIWYTMHCSRLNWSKVAATVHEQ
ncbi:uncharacterized protein LOC142635017 [Castanea sativa]|uniref:uncharacterized protein LOC142635017 n=1 Tax=Castanea sativa TaxID=21020 RepID=UPI003F651ED9